MRIFTWIIAMCLIAFDCFSQQDEYLRIRIPDAEVALEKMKSSGFSYEYRIFGDHIILEVPASARQYLDKLGLPYKIDIHNLEEYYFKRNQGKDFNAITEDFRNRDDYQVPQNFSLGTMGGFCTWEEMLVHLDTMHAKFPDLISQKQALPGQTIEGRPVYWLRISDNPNVKEDEPEVFYNGLIHAREPASMQQMLYFMYHLLENYNADAEIKNLVDHTELYFVPCVNPDGYVYNQQTHPGGGGLWRKNRRDNLNGSTGVDLNRNFGYMWGHDNYGSSPNPSSNLYRGEAPFSEPETQMIRDFAQSHNFKLVMNYHSYANLLVYSWGYVSYHSPADYDLLRKLASIQTLENQFGFGSVSRMLYLVNGDANDWFYGDESKPVSMAFTPEVGSEDEGFWPPAENIIPQCQSCLEMNIRAAQLAGFYAGVRDEGPVFIAEDEGHLPFSFSRTGLTDAPFSIHFLPLSDNIETLGSIKQYNSTPQLIWQYDSVFYQLKAGTAPGEQIKYIIKIQNETFVSQDTITKIFGQEVPVLEDAFNNFNNWESDDWFLRDNKSYSPESSMANVSGNYYANNTETFVLLKDTIYPAQTGDLWVNFKTTWDLDGGKDYVKFMVSDDGGQSWTSLAGRYTGLIFDGQRNVPVYEGEVDQWVDEWVYIPDTCNMPLMAGFFFSSDGSIGRPGFYCDDFRIVTGENQIITHEISMSPGWTGISSFVIPAETNIETLFAPGLSNLLFLSDDQVFYQPDNPNSSLTDWNSLKGYLIKTDEAFTMEISGVRNQNGSLWLEQGWNLVPVMSDQSIAVESLNTAPPGLIGMIKDACGVLIYWPAQGVSSLVNLKPGNSYFVKMTAPGQLIFDQDEQWPRK
jgi:carboxypeptidase T